MQRKPAAARGRRALRAALCAAMAWAALPLTRASAAELSLPAVREVFPQATGVGPSEGDPPAAAVFRDGRLAGYAFFSAAVVRTAGYSGKPINLLIGLDLGGVITGLRLIQHQEPILALGIDDRVLGRFIESHRGLDLRAPARPGQGTRGVDVISGATVSSLVIDDAILRAARAVARSRGLLGGPAAGTIDPDLFESATWPELLADGSLVERRLDQAGTGPDPAPLLIHLFVALANPPRIGRNLLGDRLYAQAVASRPPGEAVILIAASGLYSFKGTAFARTGEFDRIRIVQAGRPFTLRAADHRRLDALARGVAAPELREIGLFAIPAGSGFEPAQPWALELQVAPANQPGFTAEVPYHLPERHLVRAAAPSLPPEPREPGLPRTREPQAQPPVPPWLEGAVRAGLLVLTGLIGLFVLVVVRLQR